MKTLKNERGSALPIAILFVMIIAISIAGVLLFTPDKYDLVDAGEKELIALQDNVSVNGNFYLGSQTLNSEMYYYFMYENEDGGLKQTSIPSSSTTIYYLEDNEQKPHIKFKKIEYKSILKYIASLEKYEYEIYIQKDAIVNDFKVDIK